MGSRGFNTMKIKYISDMHHEFYKHTKPKLDRWLEYAIDFEWSLDNDFEVLVIAGDLCHIEEQDIVLPAIKEKLGPHRELFYIHGNHEYYASKHPIEHNPKILVKDDVVFLGTTLWFNDPQHALGLFSGLNDYRRNKGMDRVNEINHLDKEFLFREVERYKDTHKIVVVTHHPPDARCLEETFKWDSLSRFYYNRGLEDLYPYCKAWIHGHRHSKLVEGDLTIDGCKFLRNPLGYPDQPSLSFEKTRNVILEV
jgi:predicted MPP superfamily phosphohydrolase